MDQFIMPGTRNEEEKKHTQHRTVQHTTVQTQQTRKFKQHLTAIE